MNFSLPVAKENAGLLVPRNGSKPAVSAASQSHRNALGDISNRPAPFEELTEPPAPCVSLAPPVPDASLSGGFGGPSLDFQNLDQALAVPFYVEEIFQHYRSVELSFTVTNPYLERQPEINQRMRSILIDWLVDVHYKFKLQPETLYLTVNYLDRFLERKITDRRRLQLVGVTAMLIAAKYEEIYFPEIQDFVLITDRAYTREDIKKMEGLILNTLKFDLTVPTVHRFLTRYMRASGPSERDGESSEALESVAHYFAERSLQEYSMVPFVPSVVASASILLAKQYMNHSQIWNPELESLTGYKQEDLQECTTALEMAVREGRPNLQAVWRKYTRTIRHKASYIVHERIGNTQEYMAFARQ